MRLTLRLCAARIYRHQKRLWESKRARYKDEPLNVNPSLKRKIPGLLIHDPTEKELPPRWRPPVDDIRFKDTPKLEEHRLYNEEEAYKMTNITRFIEGLKQACILTKSQLFEGMPPGVSELVGKIEIPEQDLLVQRCIMHSQFWNPTKEKLPRRIDTTNLKWKFRREFGIPRQKSAKILLTNLVDLCQSVSGQVPSMLMERHLIPDPHLHTNYLYKGKLIVIDSMQNYLTSGKSELPPFGDMTLIEQSVNHELPDIFPLLPTIDFEKSHLYEVKNTYGWLKDHAVSCPQIIFKAEPSYWPSEPRVSRDAMLCLGYAMEQAKRKYGTDVKILPEPISVQCVDVNVNSINFVFFQLNTLDLDNADGIKNFLWYDLEKNLFNVELYKPWLGEDYQKTVYHSYESVPFQKMIASYVYGAPETKTL